MYDPITSGRAPASSAATRVNPSPFGQKSFHAIQFACALSRASTRQRESNAWKLYQAERLKERFICTTRLYRGEIPQPRNQSKEPPAPVGLRFAREQPSILRSNQSKPQSIWVKRASMQFNSLAHCLVPRRVSANQTHEISVMSEAIRNIAGIGLYDPIVSGRYSAS